MIVKVPFVDIEQAFLDHFIHGKPMSDIAKERGYSTAILYRAFIQRHLAISQWAKGKGLPYVDWGSKNKSLYKWVALNEYQRVVAQSNRLSTMFRFVLAEIQRKKMDPAEYIKGLNHMP
jgi:hypothetical protein